MARILPDGWKSLRLTGGAAREIETLATLEADLPDSYTVYHSVHWTRLRHGFAMFGELDFVVVSPSGRVLAIEQKTGRLDETPDGLMKTYSNKPKSVSAQLSRSIAGLRGRLSSAFGPAQYGVEELLYCPDYTVVDKAISGVNPSRIVDAPLRHHLASIIRQVLPEHESALPCEDRIHAFLAGELSLVPDAGAVIGDASKLVTQLSSGLATWARNIHFDPFRLRVVGTAGSGKTQLAIGVLHDAVKAGKKALYVCFNRPLADHVRAIAPHDVVVTTFHKLCMDLAAAAGIHTDFARSDVFATLEQTFERLDADESFRFDVIVVDEGQDFEQAWADSLGRLLERGGSWWWLEDPMQNLYLRPRVELPGWVEVRAGANYRSPRDIVRLLGQLTGSSPAIEAASPFDGSDVRITSYSDDDLVATTLRALEEAIGLGYRPSDIALLSFQGREKSSLTGLEQLGSWRLRSFAGRFDAQGAPVYHDGDVLSESVFRFKGRCAPCVILTEVDFANFDDYARSRLFVGATRATMKLFLVLSERVARGLLELT